MSHDKPPLAVVPPKKTGPGPRNDWDKIRRDYELGNLSIRELAKLHNINKGTISEKAKRQGWVTKGALAQVRARAQANLLRSGTDGSRGAMSIDIDAAAAEVADVIRYHRQSTARGRIIVDNLLKRLHSVVHHIPDLQLFYDKRTAESEDEDALSRAILKLVNLGEHAGTVRELSVAMKNLIDLERRAFNIGDDNGESEKPIDIPAEITAENAADVYRKLMR